LERATWVVVPILNVDGYEYAWNSERLWRKNREPTDGSSCIGTDLNRNYDEHWGGGGSSGQPCSETYRGSAPFSCRETNAAQKFLADLGSKLVSFVDIHAYGAMFMSPWGWTYDYPADFNVMNYYMEIAVDGIASVNSRNYAYGTSANVIYIAAGGSDDWSYGQADVLASYTVEVAGNSFTPGENMIVPIASEIYAGVTALVEGIVT